VIELITFEVFTPTLIKDQYPLTPVLDHFRLNAGHQKGTAIFDTTGLENLQKQPVNPFSQVQRGVLQKY
jgi:hypothetical protein